jgi:hypothetical protein
MKVERLSPDPEVRPDVMEYQARLRKNIDRDITGTPISPLAQIPSNGTTGMKDLSLYWRAFPIR